MTSQLAGGTTAVRLTRTGDFTLLINDVVNGSKQTCTLQSRLRVSCRAGFKKSGPSCVERSEIDLRLALGGSVGAVLAAMMVVLMYLVRAHPQKLKSIFVSFLRNEVKLALQILSEAFDFLTDTWVLFGQVLTAPDDVTRDIIVPWIVCYAVAVVVSVLALFQKARYL